MKNILIQLKRSLEYRGVKMDKEYLKRCHKAKKYLDGFLKDKMDTQWCNGWYVYIPNKSTHYVIDRIDPPERTWEESPFKVPRQEELQNIILAHLIQEQIDTDFELEGYTVKDYLADFGQDILQDNFGLWWDGYHGQATFNRLWLSYAMDVLFHKEWDNLREDWVECKPAWMRY